MSYYTPDLYNQPEHFGAEGVELTAKVHRELFR